MIHHQKDQLRCNMVAKIMMRSNFIINLIINLILLVYPLDLFLAKISTDMLPSQDKIVAHNTQKNEQRHFSQWNEDNDLLPAELSGDENMTKSLLAAEGLVAGNKSNFLLTVTAIVKTIIGSGIISMPYVMNQLGWLFGTLLFVIAGIYNQFTSVLLLKSKNLSGHSNYNSLFYEIWHSKMAKVTGSFMIVVTNLGTCIIQLIIFKSAIRNIFIDILPVGSQHLDNFYTSEIFIVLVIALLESYIIVVKKIERLRFMALTGVIGISVFMLLFVIFFAQLASTDPESQPAGNMRAFPTNWFRAASSVPNIILALGYQMNTFPIYKGMQRPSDERMSGAIAVALTFCTFSYLLIGLLGYYYVGETVGANFLNFLIYSKVSPFFYFTLKISFLISVFFAFPMLFFGGRNNVISIIQLFTKGSKYTPQLQQPAVREKKANRLFIIYGVGLYLVVVGISLAVQNIEAVFNLLGSLCASSICILLPCLFYARLVVIRQKERTVKYYVAVATLVVMTPYFLFSIAALYIP